MIGDRKHVLGNVELNVFFRSSPAPNAALPLPIDLDEAETTAVIVLAESELVGDSEWVDYVHNLAEHTEDRGFGSRLFPIMLEEAGLDIKIDQFCEPSVDFCSGPADGHGCSGSHDRLSRSSVVGRGKTVV